MADKTVENIVNSVLDCVDWANLYNEWYSLKKEEKLKEINKCMYRLLIEKYPSVADMSEAISVMVLEKFEILFDGSKESEESK